MAAVRGETCARIVSPVPGNANAAGAAIPLWDVTWTGINWYEWDALAVAKT